MISISELTELGAVKHVDIQPIGWFQSPAQPTADLDLMHIFRRIETLRSWLKILVWAVHTFPSLDKILGAIVRPLRPHSERPVQLLLSGFWDAVFTKPMEFSKQFRGSSPIWWLWFRLGKFLFGHLRCHQEILLIVLTVTDVPRVEFEGFTQSQQKSMLVLAISIIGLSQKRWLNNYTRERALDFQNAAAQANGPGEFSLYTWWSDDVFPLYFLLCNKNLIGHFPMQQATARCPIV